MSFFAQTLPAWMMTPFVNRNRWWLFVVAAILVFFLFTHKHPDTACIHNVKIYNAIELPLNCDTHSYISRGYDPVLLVTEFHNWKGRPVYMAYGVLAGQALVPIAQPVWWLLLKPGAKAKNYLKSYGRNFHTHLAYILLNIFVVFACVRAAIRLSDIPIGSIGAVGLAAAVASYDLVQGATFMFHTTIFNLVTAIGAAMYVSLGMSSRFQSPKYVAVLGLIIGLGILTYPVLVILAPAYLVGNVYGRLRWPNQSPTWKSLFGRYVLFAFFVAILPILWYLLITQVFDTRVYLAAQYGQFSWAPEAFKEGRLVMAVVAQWSVFANKVWNTLGREMTLVGVALTVLALMDWKKFWVAIATPLSFCLFIAALGILSFNFLQGYYVPRMHISVLVLAYILIARIAHVQGLHKVGAASLFSIFGYQMVNAVMETAVAM